MMRSKTFIATPPGVTIKEQLEARGMSQKEFASRMDMSEKHISHLINGDVQLTPDMAYRLEMVLGLPARFWNNLESIYREKLAKVEAENLLDEDYQISKKIPYSQMSKNGWVESTTNTKDRVINLRKFFEVVALSKLSSENLIPRIACRRLAITEKSDFALIAWAQKAKIDARSINVSPIDLSKLESNIHVIREMTRKDPAVFCKELTELLSSCGIAVVFLPHIGGSFLHGASFYDKNKIVIGLTVRGKDADKFWFSLFHEIGHIVLGHLNKSEGLNKEDEDEADKFARNTLISQEEFNCFVANRSFSEESIVCFSKRIDIDPGIVVGRLQKENYIHFSWYNNLKSHYEIVS